ncbi:hypothetical protein AB0F17_56025 [Nonomuraea sp. NPDC026600]|uniref:hypothetical protein n=1 Tax=Nonomuraea sp. NPDC026600 TaxID=3155363 RepID=UPI0033CD87A9
MQYPNLRILKAGDHIRFVCGRDDALTRVKRVSRYASFEEMLDAEGAANVNPESSREQQLANIRRIYGPEKEALGVLAIEIELLQPAPPETHRPATTTNGPRIASGPSSALEHTHRGRAAQWARLCDRPAQRHDCP